MATDKQQLLLWPKTLITIAELFNLLKCTDYLSFASRVKVLESEDCIKPVKASGLNGQVPALYNKYRIVRQKKVFGQEDHQKITALHPALHIEGYLADTVKYCQHQDILEPLSAVMWKTTEVLLEPMTIHEKSFAIFGFEKRLTWERKRIEAILAFNHLTWSFLNAHETPEPFFSYNLGGSEISVGPVLVLENKDIWFSLTELAAGMHLHSLFPEKIDFLVYGEGNKVSRSRGGLLAYLRQVHAIDAYVPIYYAGDVDAEGVHIFERLQRENPTLNIQLYKPLYQCLYKWAGSTKTSNGFALPPSEDMRVTVQLSVAAWLSFLASSGAESLYTPDERSQLAEALHNGGRIPQEAANRSVLKKMIDVWVR